MSESKKTVAPPKKRQEKSMPDLSVWNTIKTKESEKTEQPKELVVDLTKPEPEL